MSIYLNGFKSFAYPTWIHFHNSINGIIGPNGSGKSNIHDAIRWVLGDISKKKLRSSVSDDFIFSGSKNVPAVALTEVRLVFDNSSLKLNTKYREVEIMRRKYRNDGKNEYFINKQQVRRKDIIDLFAQSGFGRNSLTLISQNTISNFIEINAEQRRFFFEDAANISYYQIKKKETLLNLENTNNNLIRLLDINTFLNSEVKKLKKEKKNAENYLSIKNELKKHEINFLINKIIVLKKNIDIYKNNLSSINKNITLLIQNESFFSKNLKKINDKLLEINDAIYEQQEIIQKLKNNLDEINKNSVHFLSNKIDKKKEILDCQNQYLATNKQIELINASLKDLKNTNIQLEEKIYNSENEFNVLENEINAHKQKFYYLKAQINANKTIYNNFQIKAGLQQLLKYKENITNGIHDTIDNLIKIDNKFENVLLLADRNKLNNLVVDNENVARECIKFLKTNNLGKVHFIPLNNIRSNIIDEQTTIALQQMDNFVDILSNLISVDDLYLSAIQHLYGNIIICKNYDSACEIANATKYNYKIISLEKEIILPGGIIIGGSNDNNLNLNRENSKKINKKLNLQILGIQEIIAKNEEKLKDFENIKFLKESLKQNEILIFNKKLLLQNKEKTIIQIEQKYQKLTNKKIQFLDKNDKNKQFISILDEETIREKLNENNIKLKYFIDSKYKLDKEQILTKNKFMKNEKVKNDLLLQKNNLQNNITFNENNLTEFLQNLTSYYKLTYETAYKKYYFKLNHLTKMENQISLLHDKLKNIKNVNLNAIEEYKIKKGELEEQNSLINELTTAKNKLIKTIQIMDKTMESKFSNFIDKTNFYLKTTFSNLFNGGFAKLKYSNEKDLLTTGIDIIVQPEGKKITNLNLLSGGEKALVAISVLFAILHVNSLSFVILDEVEAALDITNIYRFAIYLKEFKDTQFIIITHRPGTMEQCELLYGTTMEEPGISKLVKVKLNEINKFLK